MGTGAVAHRAHSNATVAHRANGALAQWATVLIGVMGVRVGWRRS
jgi:hypothetical protein